MYIFLYTGAPKIALPSRFESTTAFEKGENIIIKLPFRANPKPSFKWTKNGQELKEGSRYKQEVTVEQVEPSPIGHTVMFQSFLLFICKGLYYTQYVV